MSSMLLIPAEKLNVSSPIQQNYDDSYANFETKSGFL